MKKIEPIIKKVSGGILLRLLFYDTPVSNFSFNVELQIAKYQAPGRYILKPGGDLESLNKPQTESGRYLLFLYNYTMVYQYCKCITFVDPFMHIRCIVFFVQFS